MLTPLPPPWPDLTSRPKTLGFDPTSAVRDRPPSLSTPVRPKDWRPDYAIKHAPAFQVRQSLFLCHFSLSLLRGCWTHIAIFANLSLLLAQLNEGLPHAFRALAVPGPGRRVRAVALRLPRVSLALERHLSRCVLSESCPQPPPPPHTHTPPHTNTTTTTTTTGNAPLSH